MDLHKGLEDISIPDLKKAHLADLEVENKYGIKYLKYFFNQEAGKVFCVIRAPSKEACNAAHKEAIGFTACNIVEVNPGDYDSFMGKGEEDETGLAQYVNGSLDSGNRVIMNIDLICYPYDISTFNPKYSKNKLRKIIQNELLTHEGRVINDLRSDIIVVFTTSSQALKCALSIQNKIHELFKSRKGYHLELNVGLCIGNPVTEKDEFFGEAIKLARNLSRVSTNQKTLLSHLFLKDSAVSNILGEPNLDIISTSEENFINNLLETLDSRLKDPNFKVENLSKELGMSRSQLYRKIISVSGLSPNEFIKKLRLKKALKLIRNQYGNISEVSYEVGFNDPSYFTKCFKQNFKITPSNFMKLVS